MKKLSLSLMSLLFLLPAFADVEALRIDEKVFVRPFVTKISEQLALQATNKEGGEPVATAEQIPALISINVGCNIPSHSHLLTQEGCRELGLSTYIAQIAQEMKVNGAAVITAPASYDVVFTNGSRSDEEIYQSMEEILAKIGTNQDPEVIKNTLGELHGVNRATFVHREDKLVLVSDVRALRSGEAIWRITPDGAMQDNYHSEEEYLVAFRSAGLFCEEISRPSFYGELKWKMYNDNLQDKKEALGAAYMENNAFTIYHVVKKA